MQQHLHRLKQLKQRRKPPAAAAVAAASTAGSGSALPGALLPDPAPDQQEQGEMQGQARRRRSLFPMQINLDADDVALRFEHHPLEVSSAASAPHHPASKTSVLLHCQIAG